MLAVISITRAGTTDTLTVTVTAQNVSVYANDGTVAYGTVAVGSGASSTTTGDTQYIVNTGNVTSNFNILGLDATSWDLTTSSVGSELYMHLFTTTSGAYWVEADREYITLETGVVADATSTVDFYIKLPSVTTDYTQQNANVTVQVVAQ